MTINILVLDNDLDVALGEVEKALKLYLGPGASFSVPDFFSSPSPMLPLEVPAVGSNPAASIYFKANKKRDKHGAIIVRQINNGDYDGVEFDAVILDNNWAGSEAENSGCTVILEALLQNDSFKKAKPEYMLFTWHLEDENYNRKVTETLASKRQYASITAVAKGKSQSAIAEWFGHMLRAREKHKFGLPAVEVPTGNFASSTSVMPPFKETDSVIHKHVNIETSDTLSIVVSQSSCYSITINNAPHVFENADAAYILGYFKLSFEGKLSASDSQQEIATKLNAFFLVEDGFKTHLRNLLNRGLTPAEHETFAFVAGQIATALNQLRKLGEGRLQAERAELLKKLKGKKFNVGHREFFSIQFI